MRRIQRNNANAPNDERANEFMMDVQSEINNKGIKNAVCIVLGDDDDISVITAFEDSIQVAGILDLGKICFHNDVLSNEE